MNLPPDASRNDLTPAPTPIDQHVGTRIRLLREHFEISCEQLSRATGLALPHLQAYERGETTIYSSELFLVARTLGVSVDFFFRDFAPVSNGFNSVSTHVPDARPYQPNKSPPGREAVPSRVRRSGHKPQENRELNSSAEANHPTIHTP
jgi:transcriptional regulator with XRE-family HTH domain